VWCCTANCERSLGSACLVNRGLTKGCPPTVLFKRCNEHLATTELSANCQSVQGTLSAVHHAAAQQSSCLQVMHAFGCLACHFHATAKRKSCADMPPNMSFGCHAHPPLGGPRAPVRGATPARQMLLGLHQSSKQTITHSTASFPLCLSLFGPVVRITVITC